MVGYTTLRHPERNAVESKDLKKNYEMFRCRYALLNMTFPCEKNTLTHFLAGFDERLLGYKDRSMTVHNNDLNKIDVSHNGVFKPTIMIDGVTVSIRSIKYKIKLTEITVT